MLAGQRVSLEVMEAAEEARRSVNLYQDSHVKLAVRAQQLEGAFCLNTSVLALVCAVQEK